MYYYIAPSPDIFIYVLRTVSTVFINVLQKFEKVLLLTGAFRYHVNEF